MDLTLGMREWWVPDAEVLVLMRKEQLEGVVAESGAGKVKSSSKKELVATLARYFERTADPKAKLKDQEHKGRTWVPGVMEFPSSPDLKT